MSQSWNVPGAFTLVSSLRWFNDKCCCSWFYFQPKTRNVFFFSLSDVLIFRPDPFQKQPSQAVCFSLLMTQRIPQTKGGDVPMLEIFISSSQTQHRWDLLCVLSPPAVYTSPLCQPSTISQLLFSFDSKRGRGWRDLQPEGWRKDGGKEECGRIRVGFSVLYRKGQRTGVFYFEGTVM